MFRPDSHPLELLAYPKSPEEWRDARAEQNERGLTILGHPVMQTWETPYMNALAGIATGNGGRVLEVGYGMGIAAGLIQRYPITEHVVIEANREVFERLTEFIRCASHPVTALFGFWEDVVGSLASESFDGILFDPYPISLEQLHTQRFSFFQTAFRLLRPGGVFTHYAGECEFTPEYRRLIEVAGFREYSGVRIELEPPAGCLYWDEPWILAPTIRKSTGQ